MASTKKNTKKQDEKHLKILRELCALPHNKKCFDCGQRGPTYVNMTIGSFVCTSCSGILRGLNPQHRVKSISMTSFTPTEIEFLQNAGNEVCRRSWLGLWNSPNPPEPESRDEIKVKDFMMQKYDRKSWYIPPSQLPPASPKTETSQSLPERKPLKQLLGEGSPTLVVGHSEAHPVARHSTAVSSAVLPPVVAQPAAKPPTNDLLGDLGGDPFAQPAAHTGFNAFGNQPAAPASGGGFDLFTSSQPQQQPPQQQQFGRFDAFGSNPQQTSGGFNAFGGGSGMQQPQTQPQGFNAFGTQQQQQQPQQPPQQQQPVGNFSPFGTSPPRPQQQGGFNAFGSAPAQQPETKKSSFGSFGNQPAPAASSFDAFGSFSSTQATQQTKTTSTVGNFGPMVSTSAAGAPASSGTGLLQSGDKYAALSDLDSIFKVQAPAPSAGQQSVFSGSTNTSNSLGASSMSGMTSNSSVGLSAGSSAMSSGPNPFASIGSTAPSAQSNPFQSSTGGMTQSNGFPGGNTGFGPTAQSSAQSMSFTGAGMTAMAANQFTKMGGNQPGMFGSPGGPSTMQSAGFHTGQGQISASVTPQQGGGQFGGPQLGNSQLVSSQFGSSQFGGTQFGGAQAGSSQFGVAQSGNAQMGSGQFGGFAMPQQQQQQQQQAFGGMSGGMLGTNQFGQQQQQQQQQPFGGGWQQKPQSNPFMAGGHGGGIPTQQRQSTNPFM